MTDVPTGLSWIQWCPWISEPPLIPTEELVFPLVEASGFATQIPGISDNLLLNSSTEKRVTSCHSSTVKS